MSDADYTDDLAFLENTPTQAGSLLYSLEQTAGGISLYLDANKSSWNVIDRLSIIWKSYLSSISFKL